MGSPARLAMSERSGAGCAYCGLPVLAAPPDDGPRYCCFGCRFAASITAAGGEAGESRWMMTRLGMALFFTMNVMVFTMLLWSERPGAAAEPAALALYGLARWACLLFSAPVLLLLGGPLVAEAAAEVRRGRPALNLLLAAGVAAAFLLSVHAVVTDSGHVYFEVACMVLVAVTLGKWLEASGKLRTTAALRDLERLLPDRVRRIHDAGESEVELTAVVPGDRLRVLPGERIPTDGTIVAGCSAVDEQVVSGESVPVSKGPTDRVSSGTGVIDGPLVVEVTAPPGAGTLERLIATVTLAAASGTRQQRLAERMSAWFLPLVICVAIGTLAAHWAWAGWSRAGLAAGTMAAIAVVVVSCPCALGLATPMALWAAIGRAARRHVLVRDGDAFAQLATAGRFCFDKTGTLTTGLRVQEIALATGHDETRVLALAAGLAAASTHVLSRAIVDAARARGLEPAAIDAIRVVPGCGVEGIAADGAVVRLGSERWIAATLGASAARAVREQAGMSECVLAIGPLVAGRIASDETLRPEAAAAIAALAARGAEVWMLSGDRAARAGAVAGGLGMQWRAPLLPEDKLAFVRERRGTVMVGDGINDAPALAAADVGVALGCGADVSRWTADICLLRDDLRDLPWLAALAGRTNRTVGWNLLWAFGYNAACIPLAATGWVHPALAAAAMVASSLFVVAGSLALARDESAEASA